MYDERYDEFQGTTRSLKKSGTKHLGNVTLKVISVVARGSLTRGEPPLTEGRMIEGPQLSEACLGTATCTTSLRMAINVEFGVTSCGQFSTYAQGYAQGEDVYNHGVSVKQTKATEIPTIW